MWSMPDTHAVMDGVLPVLCICAHFPKACGYKPIVAVNHCAKIEVRPAKPSKLYILVRFTTQYWRMLPHLGRKTNNDTRRWRSAENWRFEPWLRWTSENQSRDNCAFANVYASAVNSKWASGMWQHPKQDKPNFALIVLPALLDSL